MTNDNVPQSAADVGRVPDRPLTTSPRRRLSRRQIADAGVWLSVGINLWVVGFDLASGLRTAAALQSLVVVLLTAWGCWLAPTIGLLLDLRLATVTHERDTAIAQQRIAEAQMRMTVIAEEAMEEQRRSGQVRVSVSRAH